MSVKRMVYGRPQPSILRRLLREPLVHFILLGSLLFAVFDGHATAPLETASRKIVLTADDLRQMDVMWMARWRRHPTKVELDGLIDDRIREEVLFREALALGLDKDDTIIRRRMAQKMDFLAEDLADLQEPTKEELATWFAKHPARFALPGRVTFRHLFFSPDKRGQDAQRDANEALAALTEAGSKAADVAKLGDRFMLQDFFAERTTEQIASAFGAKFADAVFKLPSGTWSGPTQSGFGWHVVRVEAVSPEQHPKFEDVDSATVRTEYLTELRSTMKQKAFQALKARYQIVLSDGVDKTVAGAGR